MGKPDHTRISMIGVFAGTADATLEEWNWNLNAQPMGFQDPEDLAAAATTISAAYATHLNSFYRSAIRLTRVRVAQLDDQGRVYQTTEGAYRQGDDDTLRVGTSSSSLVYPTQSAVAVSLGTERAGPSGKGRCFLPAPAIALGSSDFRLPTTNVDTLAQAMADFVVSCSGALATINTSPALVSVVSSKGFVSPVTKVRVGRVLDTQRRRRGDMVEDYREVAIP